MLQKLRERPEFEVKGLVRWAVTRLKVGSWHAWHSPSFLHLPDACINPAAIRLLEVRGFLLVLPAAQAGGAAGGAGGVCDRGGCAGPAAVGA